jgi:alanyl-tRNA synthetase
MRAQRIRETFLDFFARRGHKIVPSSSLIPKDDPTILFANAGMNQFKNTFLGLETRTYKRAATVQKCLRVSGKHNDLETVGRTAKHHTFFEMLGNFSFGDYFKPEAVSFAWELVTEVFRLPQDRLYATVYEQDDAAFKLWREAVGLRADRIFRFGKKDNFWAMGDTGPCGPCSEIHYDLGPDVASGDPRALIEAGSDRFVELWNLVFMEFYQDETGRMTSLPAPSIDTGMGLERMAAVLQGKRSNYDTDLFLPLIEAVVERTRREYPSGGESDVSMRIIADHVRALSFLIGDGVTPANDGRGYVLRRLIRRAYRHGNLLGLEKPFLYELVGRVADIMKDGYPELLASAHYVSRVTLAEEERFAATLSSGLRYFEQYVKETQAAGGRMIPGEKVFKLYDTFGFPLDLSQELAREKGFDVDEPGFRRELEGQREKARQSWTGASKQREKQAYEALIGLKVRSLVHESMESLETEVLALLQGGRRVDGLEAPAEGEVVLAETPFYAEAGGQVGDTGTLKGPRASAVVEDTYFLTPEVIAHKVKVLSGALRPGDRLAASPDLVRRAAVSRNHTATHLLHAALREVLGDHVKQAGSLVSAQRLRFDFTHFAALGAEEKRQVERIVNEKIQANLPVTTRVTTLEEGLKSGAMAIFEEKYGEQVRLVGVEGFSRELCGGVHVSATGEIGFFKIVSESSVAAGMRRIEAVTGEEALRYIQDIAETLGLVEQGLGGTRKEIPARLERLHDQLEKLEQENRALRRKIAGRDAEGPAADARKVNGIALLARKVEGLAAGELRDLADKLKQKLGSGVVVLGQAEGDKATVVVSVTKDLTGRVKANELVKVLAARLGGGGGGRADFAQAGGSRPQELDRMLEDAAALLAKLP